MDNRINVWTYWHSDDRPAIVNVCIESWKRHLDREKFNIIILSENNVRQYLPPVWLEQIPDFQSLDKANQADFIRLSLLKFYGGVWLDASIYLLQDLSFIERFDRFYAPRFPVIDHSTIQVWFLVAPKNDFMINKWLDLFIDILKNNSKLRNKWHHVSLYSGIGLMILIKWDKKFRTYFKFSEAYSLLYTHDKMFRQKTPKPDEYGVKAGFRLDHLVNVLRAYGVLLVSKLVIYLTNSTNANDPLKLRQRAKDIMTKNKIPSITLKRDGKVILYKLNGSDRDKLSTDFQFVVDPSLNKSDE